jgi:hypothetical protein
MLLMAGLFITAPAFAGPVTVRVDASAAEAVLAALRDPKLTRDRALAISRLPGNAGLIRKGRSYGLKVDEQRFAEALLSAAQGRPSEDERYFRFASVLADAPRIGAALAVLLAPTSHTLERVRARIALFGPPTGGGGVSGYIVVGGSSGGFAFAEPEFFLNLAYFPSAPLATTIMEHEMFHAVQNMAEAAERGRVKKMSCTAHPPNADRLAALFDPLMKEGTASLVGDLLALPEAGDAEIQKERSSFARKVERVAHSVTLLSLSTHAAATGASIADDDIYALGFYGDELLYPLGYVMAKALAEELGPASIGSLVGKPGAAFIERYIGLRRYGSNTAPSLGPIVERAARELSSCAA